MIIFTAGGFDPVHEGHIELFKRSKQIGGKVIVSVARNNHMINKKGFYFMDESSRYAVISAIKYIDEVEFHRGLDGTVIENLEILRKRFPNENIVFTKGGEWTDKNIPEKEVCEKNNIKVVHGIAKTMNSSSKLVSEVIQNARRKTKKTNRL